MLISTEKTNRTRIILQARITRSIIGSPLTPSGGRRRQPAQDRAAGRRGPAQQHLATPTVRPQQIAERPPPDIGPNTTVGPRESPAPTPVDLGATQTRALALGRAGSLVRLRVVRLSPPVAVAYAPPTLPGRGRRLLTVREAERALSERIAVARWEGLFGGVHFRFVQEGVVVGGLEHVSGVVDGKRRRHVEKMLVCFVVMAIVVNEASVSF